MNRSKPPKLIPLIFCVGTTIGFLATISIAIIIGANFELTPTTDAKLIQINSLVTIFSAIQFVALFMVLVYTGIDEWILKRKLSPLHWPVLLMAANMIGLLSLASLSSIDRLAHGLTPGVSTWTWLLDPDVRLLAVGFYIGIMFGFAWFLAVILRGRFWEKLQIASLYITITIGTILLFLAIIATEVF